MTILTSKLGVSVGNLLGLNEGTNVEISVGIKLGLVVEGPLEVGPTESTNTGSTETVTMVVSQVNSNPSSKQASYSKSCLIKPLSEGGGVQRMANLSSETTPVPETGPLAMPLMMSGRQSSMRK